MEHSPDVSDKLWQVSYAVGGGSRHWEMSASHFGGSPFNLIAYLCSMNPEAVQRDCRGPERWNMNWIPASWVDRPKATFLTTLNIIPEV